MIRIFRNRDVKKIIVGIPGPSHKHLRAAIETPDGTFVFQEAIIAAIVRAYINVKTHPQTHVVSLTGRCLDVRKKEYAQWQLIEDEIDESKIESYLEKLTNNNTSPQL